VSAAWLSPACTINPSCELAALIEAETLDYTFVFCPLIVPYWNRLSPIGFPYCSDPSRNGDATFNSGPSDIVRSQKQQMTMHENEAENKEIRRAADASTLNDRLGISRVKVKV
jgi:hypothetical protein